MAVTTGSTRPTNAPAAAIPLYSQSSQFRNWRYSKAGLAAARKELNITAVGHVKGMVEEERVQQSTAPVASTSAATSASSRSASPAPSGPPPPPSEIQYLTVADELSLVTYYLTQISALCGAFQFPEMVQATAMSYLKRFYLRNTCMDYHPKNVMLTSVFLATKTENHPMSIDTFSSKTKTTPHDILSLEFLVSQSLRFEYKVHHAHLAAYGLLLDMQTADVPLEIVEAAYTQAQSFVRTSRLTDAEFIYAPAQIALAAFRLASPSTVDTWLGVKETKKAALTQAREDGRKEKGKGVAEELDQARERKSEQELEHEALLACLVEIGEMITEAVRNPVAKDEVKEVDKRLRWARNPEKDPKSALYKKRKAEEDLERDERAKAKAAKRTVSLDENVFD